MARSRLALVATEESCDGPWARCDFERARFAVWGLGPHDGVRVEYEEHTPVGLQLGVLPLCSGSNAIQTKAWERYRVCKTANGEGRATFVEVTVDV